MQTRTIRLDRVHDVAYSSKGYSTYTMFSFSSNELKIFDAEIRGAPKLRTGMNLTFAMKRTDDWQSLVGFLDHETGEIYLDGQNHHFVSIFVIICISLAIRGAAYNNHASALVVISLLAVLFLYAQDLLLGCYTYWQARKLLRQKKAELFSGQPPTA